MPPSGDYCPHAIHCSTREQCDARFRAAEPWFAVERDEARIRAELRDRLDRCTDHDHGAAFGWLADNHPDLVREALDETGAPS